MPRDGIGFGELQTSPTITIRSNAAPTTGTPLIDSVNGGIDYDDDDLIGTAVGTTDANGDVTTNIYRWLLNGESVTNLQMHFDTEVPQIPGVNGITRDYSGFGNNGVVNGSSWTQTGVIGGALSFDGNDYIRVQDNGNSLGSDGSWSKLSIEYWIKANGTSNQEAVISKHNADYSTGGFQGASYGIGYSSDFRAYANRDRFFWEVFNDTGSAEVQYSEYATFGQWHHVVCTYESGVGLKLYIDGLERASTPFSGNIDATTDGLLFIGGTGAGGEFIGLLDEVIIYDSVLSPYQVYQRYVDTKDGVSDSETIVCTSTSAGDVWRCEVIPNDSWTDGAPQLSASLTVSSDGNSAPKIYYYEPVGSTLNADLNQNITFIQFSSDPELAPLTYSWSVDSVEQATTKDLTYNFTTAGSHTVVVTVSDGALSASQSWTVTVNAGELRSLTIQAASNGNTNPAPGVYQYGLNTVALVEALPSAGYTLSYWLRNGSNVGTANPYLMVMDENYVLQPVFAQSSQYFLDVSVSGSGTTNATGIQYYDAGTSVTVQATANAGWLFSHWLVNGANVGTNSLLSLTMNANYECSAVFEQMPKLFEDGFESGDFSQWSTVVPTSGETYTVVDNLKYDGSYGARFTTNGDGGTERVYIYKNIGAQTELYVRGYFNLQSGLPLDNANNRFNIFSFVNAGAAIASMGVIRNQGADVWYINSGLGVWNATSGPATNQWYCVEFYIKIGSTDGALAVYIDGTPIISEVNRNTAALAASIDTVRCELVFVNGITHPLDLYSDCLAISNYYIGPIVEQAGQMSLAVTTNRERYLKWSNVDITVTAKDATTNALLQNANIAITVYDIHGRVAYTASGTTDANGVANFTYKLVFNAQMGTYTITATASLTGYDNGNGQASFYSLG